MMYAKPEPQKKRRGHRDPVTPEVREYVLTRDGGCVGPRLEMDRECFGRLTLDHVVNGGKGRRGPSTPGNLVTLCGGHHYQKTVNARTWRPVLVAYLFNVEGATLPQASGNAFAKGGPDL
jgi:hypothetical protein